MSLTGEFLKAEIVGNDFSPARCGSLLWSLETAQAGSQSRSAPHIVCVCVLKMLFWVSIRNMTSVRQRILSRAFFHLTHQTTPLLLSLILPLRQCIQSARLIYNLFSATDSVRSLGLC